MAQNLVRVLRLEIFSKRAKKLFTETEIEDLSRFIAENPKKGSVIPGTGGLRKLRWSLRDRGKRGGSRVIYYYHVQEYMILLLSVYAKNQKEDLSKEEKRVLKAAVEEILG